MRSPPSASLADTRRLDLPGDLVDPTPARGSGRTRLFRGVFAIWPAAWPVHGYAAGAEHLSPRRWLQRLESPAAGLRGQARLPSVMNFGTHAQGAALQESIFAGAGRQSRAELAVLARDAQEFPLMVDMHVIVRHQHRGCCPFSARL